MTSSREVTQAGCVVFYGEQVVLRRTTAGHWVFPKGHVEPGETLADTAVREVAEEAGLVVELGRPLGDITFVRNELRYRVHYFLARVTAELPTWTDHLGRDTFLFSPGAVREILSFDNTRALWDALNEQNERKEQQ